jgi:cytochrome P450
MQEENMVLNPYGKKWRDMRRIVDNYFRPAAMQAYQHVQNERAAIAMTRLANDPAQCIKHIRE